MFQIFLTWNDAKTDPLCLLFECVTFGKTYLPKSEFLKLFLVNRKIIK